MGYVVGRTRAQKVWIRPRLRQLRAIVRCAIGGHVWGRGWRRETEDWFEYVDGPGPWAWRCCGRCSRIEECRPR